jgi:hypothetical protein
VVIADVHPYGMWVKWVAWFGPQRHAPGIDWCAHNVSTGGAMAGYSSYIKFERLFATRERGTELQCYSPLFFKHLDLDRRGLRCDTNLVF